MNELRQAGPNNPAHPPEWERVAECLYRHKSSGVYYGLVKRGGKQFRRSLKTPDRKLADSRLRNFREKAARLTSTGRGSQILFEELAARWLERIRPGLKPSSFRRREVSIAQLNQHFGKMVVRNISARECDGWVVKRSNRSASTFNNERETLRLALDFACRDGLLLENPANTVERRKMERHEIKVPTRAEFKILMEGLRKSDSRYQEAADLVEFLAYSGTRLGEATGITWADVDFESKRFVVSGGEAGTKNHEARTVPLFPNLQELLERMKKRLDPKPSDRINPIDTAKKAMASICRKQGLPAFTHHCLRHFFVSNAVELNIDFKVIAGWIGHKDGGILVAKTYGHLRDSHSTEMAKKMTFSLS